MHMIYPSWIEIPARDVDRAAVFYQAVFAFDYGEVYDDGERRVAILIQPSDGKPGVSLNETKNFEPSSKGTLMYLNVGSDLAPFLERVTAAGGTIITPQTPMSATSTYAIIGDTEGNALALSFSQPAE
jgi:predicted enzyme related to lactoylglutathione lyase